MTVVWPKAVRGRVEGVATGSMADIHVPDDRAPPAARRTVPPERAWEMAARALRRIPKGVFGDLWQPGVPGYEAALAAYLVEEHQMQESIRSDRKAEQKAVRRRIHDLADDHQRRTRGRVMRPTAERESKPDRQGGQIARYGSRGEITKAQQIAAERMLQDYWNAGGVLVIGRLVSSYGDAPPRTGGAFRPPLTEIEGRRAYEEALAAVGPEYASVLEHVVILGNSARSWGEALGCTSERSSSDRGIRALRVALDALAQHYRLT